MLKLDNNISSLVDKGQEDFDRFKNDVKNFFRYYLFMLMCLGVGAGIGMIIEMIVKWMWFQ